jgi:hypothetical protein
MDGAALAEAREDGPFWHRRSIVTPAPDCHFRTTERSSRGSVTTEGYLENEVVPPTGKPTLKAR